MCVKWKPVPCHFIVPILIWNAGDEIVRSPGPGDIVATPPEVRKGASKANIVHSMKEEAMLSQASLIACLGESRSWYVTVCKQSASNGPRAKIAESSKSSQKSLFAEPLQHSQQYHTKWQLFAFWRTVKSLILRLAKTQSLTGLHINIETWDK